MGRERAVGGLSGWLRRKGEQEAEGVWVEDQLEGARERFEGEASGRSRLCAKALTTVTGITWAFGRPPAVLQASSHSSPERPHRLPRADLLLPSSRAFAA